MSGTTGSAERELLKLYMVRAFGRPFVPKGLFKNPKYRDFYELLVELTHEPILEENQDKYFEDIAEKLKQLDKEGHLSELIKENKQLREELKNK